MAPLKSFARPNLPDFPKFNKDDVLLVIAPHIDDEVISTAGLIQSALGSGATVSVIYMTNGDANVGAVLAQKRLRDVSHRGFIRLGELRMKEGIEAGKILGLGDHRQFFLGFPDYGISRLLNNNLTSVYTSPFTKFSSSNYAGTYKLQQEYIGANLVSNLKELIAQLKPNYVLTPHPLDRNSDHHSTYFFVERVLRELGQRPRVFSYPTHFRDFLCERGFRTDLYMYPPKLLSQQDGWFSYDLSEHQLKIKLAALEIYSSQLRLGKLRDLVRRFVRKNEIFQEMI